MRLKTCVIIPCYKVKNHILGVVNSIPKYIDKIYIVDDYCPEQSGNFVRDNCIDPRITLWHNKTNLGVGGAVKVGYTLALEDNCHIAIKIDGDGQMNPDLINEFLTPLLHNKVIYAKGNRFFQLNYLQSMPKIRIFGNSALSFITKLSTGNWNLMDPTNGYTAIRCDILKYLNLDAIDNRFFFETDVLFQLGLLRAKIIDIPIHSNYGSEVSNLSIGKSFFSFGIKHIKLFFKRIAINYFLRDFNAGSILLLLGIIFSILVVSTGIPLWIHNAEQATLTPTGTVVKFLLFSILGIGGVLGWLIYDAAIMHKSAIEDLLIDYKENFNIDLHHD
jgi:glycosyltransferase involved in cell wall biosynthesis